jgi:hypothetical protein
VNCFYFLILRAIENTIIKIKDFVKKNEKKKLVSDESENQFRNLEQEIKFLCNVYQQYEK